MIGFVSMPSQGFMDGVNRINSKIKLKIPGAFTEYKSTDAVIGEDKAVNYYTGISQFIRAT